jgi:hypothetical protein
VIINSERLRVDYLIVQMNDLSIVKIKEILEIIAKYE